MEVKKEIRWFEFVVECSTNSIKANIYDYDHKEYDGWNGVIRDVSLIQSNGYENVCRRDGGYATHLQ